MNARRAPSAPPKLRLALCHEGLPSHAEILRVMQGRANRPDRVHVGIAGILQHLRDGDLGRLNGQRRRCRKSASGTTTSASYCPDERWTVWIPSFIVLRRLTYSSGRVQRTGTFNPIKLAMLPMNDVQLDVSAFQTGEVACNCLM